MELTPGLRELVHGQDGHLLRMQAAHHGLTDHELMHGVADGTLVHLNRGLYALRASVPADAAARHLHLARGALLLHPDACLNGVTAVLAHGLPAWGAPLDRVELIREIQRSVTTRALHVRCGAVVPVDTPFGPAVPVGDALAQLALDCGAVPAVCSADAALHTGLVREEELAECVDVVAQWPRSGRARAMLAMVDGRSESVGESRTRVALTTFGITVVPQVELRDARGWFVARADFVVDGERVVVEFDGRQKYADGDPTVLWAEKNREDRIRALGYVVVRLTWADLEHPSRMAAKVRNAIATSRALAG